jgi:hypothetical protein
MKGVSRRRVGRCPTPLTLRILSVLSVVGLIAAGAAHAGASDPRPGRWSGGVGIGFLANTPDGPEFGLAGYADYVVAPRLSVGPLVQYGGVGNDVVAALSVQAKYWWSFLASGNARLVVQAGIGAIAADIEDADTGAATSDTSFVIPLGIGVDYAVTPRVAVTADFILNLTSLGEVVSVGGRNVDLRATLIPAFFLGVRF